MTYDILIASVGDWLWQVNVVVKDDVNDVLCGETTVACATKQEAQEYAEKIFLPDLRRNFPRQLGELILPWEAEVLPDDNPAT